MSGIEIAKLTEYFNIAAVCAAAVFAVLGILALISRKFGLKAFRAGMFAIAFGIASLVAFVLEVTIFNFQHYLKFFAGSELRTTEVSSENQNIILTSDGTFAELLMTGDGRNSSASGIGIVFKDVGRKVTSVFADIDFKGNDTVSMFVRWSDEAHVFDGYTKTLYRWLPHDNYAPVQPFGKVSELSVAFFSGGKPVDLISVSLNRPIPFYFSGLRLGVVSMLFFVLFILFSKKLRVRVSYYLFECKFDPASKKQNIVFALLLALLVFFSWISVYTTPDASRFIKGPMSGQYSKYLVDALMNGRLWLDYGNPEKLLGAERPYNYSWLAYNGYIKEGDGDQFADWVWYEGKFYSYYGVVPVILLLVPYKMITGSYLSLYAAVFLFVSAASCFLAALWRHCVKKYMPDARFAFYILSFAALFFTMLQFYILRYPTVWSTAQASGFMFVSAGIFLLLKSIENENVNRLKIFFACLCFAFAVGCRPNLVLASLVVPIVLWRYRSWKLLAFIAIPYVMVAVPLCAYNYARFESIFEFGTSYVIGLGNVPVNNPIARITGIFTTIAYCIVLPNYYKLHFPFVEYYPISPTLGHIMHGAFQYRQLGSGLVNFPIVFFLFYLFKKDFRTSVSEPFRLSATFVIVGAVILLGTSCIAPWFHGRYMVDFIVFVVLSSLFCAYFWCNSQNSVHQPRTRLKVTYVLLAASIFVGLFLYVSGDEFSPKDPALYRYLERSLGFFRDI